MAITASKGRIIIALQALGRSLMLPIAVLPVAALLLRLGQPDLLDIAFLAQAGNAIFANLGLMFAIGVAVGFARDGGGAAGLAGLVCYLVARNGAEVLVEVPPEALASYAENAVAMASENYRQAAIGKLSVPIGIVSGLIAGKFYNRYSGIALPEYLAFFGGKRFVPIVSGLAGIGVAAVVGFGWSWLDLAIDTLSRQILATGEIGLFVFGVLNRILIVSGLHHILNNLAWFVIGDFEGATGDLRRFFAGDPNAGAFMAGFFPVMMFGLPAACLAMYHEALPAHRKRAGGLLFSMALTSFLTGVTEPIEFAFMFLAPVLYLIHAVLTGASLVILDLLNVKLGFGFSAGLFDYVLNFSQGTNPLLMLPVGAAYAVIYYTVFRFAIRRFDLKTLGREDAAGGDVAHTPSMVGEQAEADAFIAALGGAENLNSVTACMTRLRLEIVDSQGIDEDALKSLGAKGFVYPSQETAQIIIGPLADSIASAINHRLGSSGQAVSGAPQQRLPAGRIDKETQTAIAAALGGTTNIRWGLARANRLCLRPENANLLDQEKLKSLGMRGQFTAEDGTVHILWDRELPELNLQEAA